MELEEILRSELEFRYRLLSRMKSDCEYYLGNGNGYAGHLWARDAEKQIEAMKAIWNSFPEDQKPEWLSMEQIEEYGHKMGTAPARNVRALLIPVLEEPREVSISADDSLHELQQHVGGMIEPLDVLGGGISLYVNDEGLWTQPPNRALYATKEMEEAGYLSQMDFSRVVKEGELYTILFGNIVAVAYDENMELKDLSQEQIDSLKEQFEDVSSGFREVLKISRRREETSCEDRDGVSLSAEKEDMLSEVRGARQAQDRENSIEDGR